MECGKVSIGFWSISWKKQIMGLVIFKVGYGISELKVMGLMSYEVKNEKCKVSI